MTLDKNSPGPVTVQLDSPLILICNLTRPNQNKSRVNWIFQRDLLSPAKTLAPVSYGKEELDKMMFRVTSKAKEEDSGWYFCNVTIEIPKLEKMSSSGKEVVVSKYYRKEVHD